MSSPEDDPIDRLQAVRELDVDEFEARVREEAGVIREQIDAGTFDNPEVAVGLEHEFYAVQDDTGRIRRVPRSLLSALGFERELGLHDAELSTGVHPLNGPGLAALRSEVVGKVQSVQRLAAEEGIRFVSDGVWTIGPERNTTEGYLTEATHEEGLTLAINVSNAMRYHGFGSIGGPKAIGGHVEVPGATIDADSAGPVSLTHSIQPHYQCRRAAELPDFHGIALRLAGPLLAIGANSPFLPPELYDDQEPSREHLLREGYAETRVPIYEGMMNPAEGAGKVRFPEDVETPGEAVGRIVDDEIIVPADIPAGERFDDAFAHFRHKHGSYWRWVRPVFDGATSDAANARIEFRPLPGQPTLPDTTAFLATFAGLMTAIEARDHPVRRLPWADARANFYAAARDGFDADLVWITADGDRTTDPDRLFEDLFDVAVDGLRRHGLGASEAAAWVDPLRARVDRRLTPAGWKRRVVASQLDDGKPVDEAVRTMQRRYIERQRETLSEGSFADWPVP